MTATVNCPVLVVVQLSGGNDYINTIVPYANSDYYDNRLSLQLNEEEIIKIDNEIGFNPYMGPLKGIYDRGDLAVIHGVGWEGSNRSHFRCMDIWHTAEPDKVGSEGWLGRAIRELDPQNENPVTAANIGHTLPRALAAPGASVASVTNLERYGFLTAIEEEQNRNRMLDRFSAMYAPAIGTGPVMDYFGQTGRDALRGADMLKVAPANYTSSVEYAPNPLGTKLRDVARIHLAGLGTRIFYTEHGGFDTHAAQGLNHPKLWTEVSNAVSDFWDDLREHDADENVVMFIFSEFGRRVRENGTGTDHGAGGVAFAIGPSVDGGLYGVYPSLHVEALKDGDLVPTQDFRGIYTAILEDWLNVDSIPIVNGTFDHPKFIAA